MRKYILLPLLYLVTTTTFAQEDSTHAIPNIFFRIEQSVKKYKVDTTTPPNDKTTKKIIELRNLKGGFNITEVIDFKLEEDRQKKEKPAAELDKLSSFFKTGNGRKWLDNAVIWIHRQHFTYRELKQLVRFYKTSAGQKFSSAFPIILVESVKASEIIMGYL